MGLWNSDETPTRCKPLLFSFYTHSDETSSYSLIQALNNGIIALEYTYEIIQTDPNANALSPELMAISP